MCVRTYFHIFYSLGVKKYKTLPTHARRRKVGSDWWRKVTQVKATLSSDWLRNVVVELLTFSLVHHYSLFI